MTPEIFEQYDLAYAQLPFKRNQDVIKIIPGHGDLKYTVSVVDGWHNLEFIKGNKEGRGLAELVARKFPVEFLALKKGTIQQKAEKVAESMEKQALAKWPAHVGCVGIFLFQYTDKSIIVTIGSVVVLLWNGKTWYKPKEIGDYSLDYPKKFPSDVSRFIGRGELKKDPLYSYKPDTLTCSPNTPLMLATDGLEKVLTVHDINKITSSVKNKTPKTLIFALLTEIRKRKTQKDDISILLRI